MTSLRIIPLLVSTLLFGCATPLFSPESIPVAAALAKAVARDGTVMDLQARTQDRIAFLAGKTALDALLKTTNIDVAELKSALSRLPLDTIVGPGGAIILTNLNTPILIFQLATSMAFNVQSSEAAAAIALAVRDGITEGLLAVPARGNRQLEPGCQADRAAVKHWIPKRIRNI